MDFKDRPQILEHLSKSVNITVYDTKWIPCSARFVALGAHARGTGALQIYEMQQTELKLVKEVEKQQAIKCGSFGASSLVDRHLATGDFGGKLCIYDLERPEAALFNVQAHASIVNAMDAIGGPSKGYGAPEIATCGRDGAVRVWDVRQRDAPVAAFEPAEGQQVRDCWCVAFGNSFNDDERCLLAGYDNGDVKMFDLKMNKVRWETNVRNGVCGVEFDRRDIPMNKVMATCLESQFHVFDARTQHPTKGLAQLTETVPGGATIWASRHLPQNRDVFMVQGGAGSLFLYKYVYPDQRKIQDKDGGEIGVAGTVELLSNKNVSTQPVGCFDWHADKEGLCVMGSYDQCIRVGIVTKLNKV